MSEYIFQFEYLPNELLFHLFGYFHIDELHKIFFNLNTRFNRLIQSIPHLSLIVSHENYQIASEYQRFSSQLLTLTIDGYLNVNLFLFTNIRNLILVNPPDQLLKQFDQYSFPYLEHLAIKCVEASNRIEKLYEKIFSNDFPRLKSYYNLNYQSIESNNTWQISSSLQTLKFGYVNMKIIETVISICPNLSYLDFGIILPGENLSKIVKHNHLKHLTIRTSYNSWIKHECLTIFEQLFSCFNQLEKFSFHRHDHTSVLRKTLTPNDWFPTILCQYLVYLKQFRYHFHIFSVQKRDFVLSSQTKSCLNQIESYFQTLHKHSYHAHLIID